MTEPCLPLERGWMEPEPEPEKRPRRYGVPYKGSKNAIARWVIEQLPAGQRLVDAFAGGCAVTHAALLSRKWPAVLANDLNDTPSLFLRAATGGFQDEKRWISREDFFALKDSDPYIRQCWSFGNDGKTYLYGRELEPMKRAAHMAILGETVQERYQAHRLFVRELLRVIQTRKMPPHTNTLEDVPNLERLISLHSLEGLQSLGCLQSLQSLQGLTVTRGDYRDIQIQPGDIVYCDIPYRHSEANEGDIYSCGGFDFEAFYAWACALPVPVFVSEYSMPEDRFECVAERWRYGHLSSAQAGRYVTERIFRPRGGASNA